MFSFTKGKSLSIDLGTANTLIYMNGEIVLNEPSVVSVSSSHKYPEGRIIAVGEEAKSMLGRTPGSIKAIRPMKDGVIADFKITEKMLQHFIKKIISTSFFSPSPKVIICVPCGATQVERRAIRESAIGAGAKEVFLIEEPIAAAIGSGLDIDKAIGTMVIDIGGGTTEIAIMSLGGIVYSDSLRVGGDFFDDTIIRYVRNNKNIVIGDNTAERIKKTTGCAFKTDKVTILEFKGRDIAKGIPVSFKMSNIEVLEALQDPLNIIVNNIKSALEQTPAELSADIAENGLVLTGGGALMPGMDKLIENVTGIGVKVAEDPLMCVAKGGGMVLDMVGKNTDFLSEE